MPLMSHLAHTGGCVISRIKEIARARAFAESISLLYHQPRLVQLAKVLRSLEEKRKKKQKKGQD